MFFDPILGHGYISWETLSLNTIKKVCFVVFLFKQNSYSALLKMYCFSNYIHFYGCLNKIVWRFVCCVRRLLSGLYLIKNKTNNRHHSAWVRVLNKTVIIKKKTNLHKIKLSYVLFILELWLKYDVMNSTASINLKYIFNDNIF